MMTIWRFNSAPSELRSLYTGTGEPEWVMQVPLSFAKDLKKDFVSAWQVYRHGGTMIYFGAAKSMALLIAEAQLSQQDEQLGGSSPKH